MYIVQMKAAEKIHHSGAINATARVVIDKEHSVLLKLTGDSLASTAGDGDGNTTVIARRK